MVPVGGVAMEVGDGFSVSETASVVHRAIDGEDRVGAGIAARPQAAASTTNMKLITSTLPRQVANSLVLILRLSHGSGES